MKVLVTGGAGYIGSQTTHSLLEWGHEVVVYDNLSTGFRDAVPSGAKFIFGDIRDGQLLGRVMKDQKIEAVMHFAAKLIVPESVEKPWEYYETNVQGGLKTLVAAKECGVRAFIFSSTAAVYGETGEAPVEEETPLRPVNPYGASKVMMEQILADSERAGGPPFLVLRYFNVAGAMADASNGQRREKAAHLIHIASRVAAGALPEMAIFGEDYPTPDGTCVRDYIHVVDLAEAHVAALDYLERGGTSLTLNCGYGRGFSVKEVLTSFQKVLGRELPLRRGPRRAGDPARIVASARKVREVLNWHPRFDDLEEICRSALAWEMKFQGKSSP